jgi:hypothetical protein
MISLAGAFVWILENILNGMAYLAIRVSSPIQAKKWIERIALIFPRIVTIDDARRMTRHLGARGTCLSRSIAVAACGRNSHVVIGIAELGNREGSVSQLSAGTFRAHAWVEIDEVAIMDKATSVWREVGRMRPRAHGGNST